MGAIIFLLFMATSLIGWRKAYFNSLKKEGGVELFQKSIRKCFGLCIVLYLLHIINPAGRNTSGDYGGDIEGMFLFLIMYFIVLVWGFRFNGRLEKLKNVTKSGEEDILDD